MSRLKMGVANPFNDSPLRSTAPATQQPEADLGTPQLVRSEHAAAPIVQLATPAPEAQGAVATDAEEPTRPPSSEKAEAKRPRGAPKKLEEEQRKFTGYADASAVAAVEYEVFRRRQAGDLTRASDVYREIIHAWAKKHPLPS